MESQLLKIINLDFVSIEIYPNFLITTIKEGVVFDTNELEIIYQVFENQFPNTNFGLIANRVHDYTVNPTCYLESSKYKRLKAMLYFVTKKPVIITHSLKKHSTKTWRHFIP